MTTFQPGHPRFGGRRKGTPNKLASDVRQAVLRAFDEAGGEKYLVRIAREQPAVFCALLAKLLPRDVRLESDSPLVVVRDYTGRSALVQDHDDPAVRPVQG